MVYCQGDQLDLYSFYMIQFAAVHNFNFHGFMFGKIEFFLFVFRGGAFLITTFYTKSKVHPTFCGGEDLLYTNIRRLTIDPMDLKFSHYLFTETLKYGTTIYEGDANGQLAIIDWIISTMMEHIEIGDSKGKR